MSGQEDAVSPRLLAEGVDFLLQRNDLSARFSKGGDQLLVLPDETAHAGLRLSEAVFDHPGHARRLGEPAAQTGDLLFEEPDLVLQLFDFLSRCTRLGMRIGRALRAAPARWWTSPSHSRHLPGRVESSH